MWKIFISLDGALFKRRLILLSFKFEDNRSNHNNYECMKASMHCVVLSPQILTKLEFVKKY